jgi:hypothetical protein
MRRGTAARNSSFIATDSITNAGTTTSVDVADTMLEGGAVSGTGFTCLGVYDQNFDVLDPVYVPLP